LGLAAIPVAAQVVCCFFGSVTLDGLPAPDGTVIKASLLRDGTLVGETTTLDSQYAMIIPGVAGVPAQGDRLCFYVVVDGDDWCGGEETWNNGEIKELNLDADPDRVCGGVIDVPLASIIDNLVIIYGYKAAEGADGWTVFNPEWVETHADWNTLETLYIGRGYWIKVDAACPLVYERYKYELDKGWNLIGWFGP
ncbi:unnamed protein product, partial [marine sediment metagenome]